MGSMTFTLTFGGVQLCITPSSNAESCSSSFISGVRHCNGYIEAELSSFTGKIVISEVDKQYEGSTQSHVVVDALMEEEANGKSWVMAGEKPLPVSNSGYHLHDGAKEDILSREMVVPNAVVGMEHHTEHESAEVYDPFKDNIALTFPDEELTPTTPEKLTINVGIDSDDDEKKIQHESLRRTRFDLSNIEKDEPEIDLSLHKACESEYTDVCEYEEVIVFSPLILKTK